MVPSSDSRSTRDIRIASPRILDLLWEKHIRYRIDLMGLFYDLFQADTISAPAAGQIFKLRIHQVLVQAQTIQLFPVGGFQSEVNIVYNDYAASKKRQNPTNLRLVKSAEHPLDKISCPKMNHYYRPKSKTFPSVDSLLLVHPPGEQSPILLMFQITRNKKEHDVNEKGLHKIDGLQLPSGTRKYYVVVAPESIYPKTTVPKAYFQDSEQREVSAHGGGEGEMSTDEGGFEEWDDEDQGTAVDEDQEMAAGEGQGMADETLFPVFHYPVRMEELFASKEPGHP